MKCHRMDFRGVLPVLGEMINSLVFLLLIILNYDWNEVAGQSPPQGFKYASYEVMIPQKLIPRYGQEEPLHVTYILQVEGRNHVVRLRQKRDFVFKHIPVFTYSKDGKLQVDYPFIMDDCFYHGFIQDKPNSLVTLSTCSGGLRGILQLGNKTYEIEPVQASATFQHVAYRLEKKEDAIHMSCGLTEDKPSHQHAMMLDTKKLAVKSASGGGWWTHRRYAKIAIVVEHERYVRFDRNETLIAMNVLNIIHIVNSLYKPLGLQVAIVGLEIWSDKNFIGITDRLESTLEDFNNWRKNALTPRLGHDAGHIFVYKTFGSHLGLSYIGGVCDPEYASGIESYTNPDLFFMAVIFAHELGHNLGMVHDTSYCSCGVSDCIMGRSHSHSNMFSNCSYIAYYRVAILGSAECLKIPPDYEHLYKYCGNKVVENEEECDCGSESECQSDTCCQSNCKLRSGAVCAFGACCDRCQFLPAGKLCRKKTDICNFPEYCNGTSAWCPEDVYVQDGAPCSDGAYCYHGNCATHNKQCKMIFGTKATRASDDCFKEVNARGDRFGNCGMNSESGTPYKDCKADNLLCGRIQCENIDTLPSLGEHSTIIQTKFDNKMCWGTDYHSGLETADIGAVRDGTPCGRDMMCLGGECAHVSLLKYDCNITKCHNRGICNSHKHCHCGYGWAPPDCLSKGYGGSIDSGPPPSKKIISSSAITQNVIVTFILSTACFGAALGMSYRNILRQRFTRWISMFHLR